MAELGEQLFILNFVGSSDAQHDNFEKSLR
jgi:hypothetical protein